MERLTIDEFTRDMRMYELAHNSCYVGENGEARYRNFDKDVDTRDYIRQLMLKYGTWEEDDAEMTDDDSFDESMIDLLFHGEETIEGIIALLYLHMWSKADLHGRLKDYEETNLTPEQMLEIDKAYSEQAKELRDWKEHGIKLPCKVGDTIYQPTRNFISEFIIDFIEISTCDCIFMHTRLKSGINMTGEIFAEDRIGKTVFLTKEEAEAKLKEMDGE